MATLPDPHDLGELRRALPAIAAILVVLALAFPVWRIDMHAVQYPGEVLTVELYAYPRVEGDYEEVALLNHYIGFYYPDPVYWQPNYDVQGRAIDVPEWSFGPLAFLAIAAGSLAVSLAPSERSLKRGLRWLLVGSTTTFVGALALLQYRLHQAGHALDPDAPVMGVDGFTPPVWGKYEIANITAYAEFGLGGYLAGLAVGLVAVAYLLRETRYRVGDLPALCRRLPAAARRLPDLVRRRVPKVPAYDHGEERPSEPAPGDE